MDIIADILWRLRAEGIHAPPENLRRLEHHLRTTWGGQRHYVAMHGDAQRHDLQQRNQHILAAHQAGESDEQIAHRYGLSVKRVQQIIRPLK